MSEELAKMLRESSFATVIEAQKFIRWFSEARQYGTTAWDKERKKEADAIVELAKAEGAFP